MKIVYVAMVESSQMQHRCCSNKLILHELNRAPNRVLEGLSETKALQTTLSGQFSHQADVCRWVGHTRMFEREK